MPESFPSTHRFPSADHTIWLRDQNAAFVYLPKVACTSWKLFLARALQLPLPEPLPLAAVHDREQVPLPYVSSLKASEQARFHNKLLTGGISLMAVIREPRQRVLSAYLDKVWLHRNPNSYFSQVVLPELRSDLQLDERKLPSFLQFLQWLQMGRSSSCSNDHWLPQRTLIGHADVFAKTQFWPMECLHEAVTAMQRLIGTDQQFPCREDLAPRKSSGSELRLEEEFTDEVEQRFREIYGDDLDLYHWLIQERVTAKSAMQQ